MKVLFLDVDGVLNSHRSAIAYGAMPWAHELPDVSKFDHVAVGLIRGIAIASGAFIVLSSAWRTCSNWGMLGPALRLPIMDRTPRLLGPRGKEIAAWLADHPAVTQYAIVDDDPDMLPEQMPYFVKTHMHNGLTWQDAERLAELLGIRIFDANRGRPLSATGRTLQWDEPVNIQFTTDEASAPARWQAPAGVEGLKK